MGLINEYMPVDNDREEKLKRSFIEASKSNKFRELLKTLPANEELLMKYTSKLEDAAIEFENCMNCKCLSECKNKIKGYIYKPVVNDNYINFEYQMCHYEMKLSNEESYQKNIEVFQMSDSLKKANFKSLYTDDNKRIEVIKFFKNFQEKKENTKRGLYLHGNFGSGKTYLIAAFFNEMAKKNNRCAIVYYPEFLRTLKESFESDEYKEKMSYIKKVDLLLLDDIGAESLSSWSRDEILSSILQYRMENNLPMFFTSNLTIDELEEHLSQSKKGVEQVKARRIIERIKYMCNDIELISKNRRN